MIIEQSDVPDVEILIRLIRGAGAFTDEQWEQLRADVQAAVNGVLQNQGLVTALGDGATSPPSAT